MGHGYKSGAGSASLNFKVVAGTTEPTNPKENMIWVKTSNKITGWYFSATQPENMAEGEVLIETGDISDVAFNALKKNAIQVYPIFAKQMVSGNLKELTAKTYQNGAWKEWETNIVIVPNPNKFSSNAWTTYNVSSFSVSENNVYINASPVNSTAIALTPIKLGNQTKLQIDANVTWSSNVNSTYLGIFEDSQGSKFITGYYGKEITTNSIKNSYDISALTKGNKYYVGFVAKSTASGRNVSCTINSMIIK